MTNHSPPFRPIMFVELGRNHRMSKIREGNIFFLLAKVLSNWLNAGLLTQNWVKELQFAGQNILFSLQTELNSVGTVIASFMAIVFFIVKIVLSRQGCGIRNLTLDGNWGATASCYLSRNIFFIPSKYGIGNSAFIFQIIVADWFGKPKLARVVV